MFLLGKYENQDGIHAEMSRVYSMNNSEYHNHLRVIELKD